MALLTWDEVGEHLFETGDDHAVVAVVPDLVKGLVEGQHVVLGDVLRLVALHLQQLQRPA